MQIVDLIIEADWALSLDDSTPAPIPRAALVVDHGRVITLAAASEIHALYQAREHCLRPRSVLLPGFVNGHADSNFATRGAGAATRESLSDDTLLALAQIAFADYLRAGITCVAEWACDPEAIIRAARNTRIRTIVQLPIGDKPTRWSANARDALNIAERVWDELRAHPTISAAFAVSPTDSLTSSALADVRRIADQVDAPIGAAWLGAATDIQDCIARHGRRPLRWLADGGLLRHGFTAAQNGALERDELDLLARTGGSLIYTPQAALRQGVGAVEVRAADAAGVPLGLGTGPSALLGTPDLLLEARLAHILAEQAGGASNARRALQRAALGGARARGIDGHTGSLAPGKAADFIVVDLDAIRIEAYEDLAAAILFGATSANVTDVWVAGRHLVAGRELVELDAAQLSADHARILRHRTMESAA